MIIGFTSALLQQMFTEIIITNANCPVKEKKSAEDNLKYFSYFSRKECFTIHANSLLFIGDSLHEMSNPVLSNYVF